jgi:hypothetical protein
LSTIDNTSSAANRHDGLLIALGHLSEFLDEKEWSGLARDVREAARAIAQLTAASPDIDQAALDVACRFTTDDDPQRRAQLQVAVIEAIKQALTSEPAIDPSWRLEDRVEFALRDAGFAEDEASGLTARLTSKPAGVDDQWVCQKCGCTAGVAGEPSWTHGRAEHPVEAMWRCDRCDADHFIKLWDRQIAAPTKPDSEACSHEWATTGGGSGAAVRSLACRKCGQHRDYMAKPSQPVGNAGEVVGQAAGMAVSLIARFLFERDDSLSPGEADDHERTESAKLILKTINELAQPAPADEVGGEAMAWGIADFSGEKPELWLGEECIWHALNERQAEIACEVLNDELPEEAYRVVPIVIGTAQPSQEDARDAELIDWLERFVRKGWLYGASFDFALPAEGERGGYRFMKRGHLGDRHPSIRAAIRAAMAASGGKANG